MAQTDRPQDFAEDREAIQRSINGDLEAGFGQTLAGLVTKSPLLLITGIVRLICWAVRGMEDYNRRHMPKIRVDRK